MKFKVVDFSGLINRIDYYNGKLVVTVWGQPQYKDKSGNYVNNGDAVTVNVTIPSNHAAARVFDAVPRDENGKPKSWTQFFSSGILDFSFKAKVSNDGSRAYINAYAYLFDSVKADTQFIPNGAPSRANGSTTSGGDYALAGRENGADIDPDL